MAETKTKTVNTLEYVFDTNQAGKTLTKSFTDFDTTVTDDIIKTVGQNLATNKIFADDAGAVISSLKEANVIQRTIRKVDVTAAA